MRIKTNWLRAWALVLVAAFTMGMVAIPACTPVAFAQTIHKKKNFAQRHPMLTSAAAGIAAYKIAKKTGQNRAAVGRKKNFAQRHPMLTGIAAAAVTHHYIKKSMRKNR
jgi:cellobiose-specific phosphotransferase system component IIC